MNNPYRSSSPSADKNLSAEESSKQAKILSSGEIVALEEAIAAGDEQVAFSYEPLPKEIGAP